MLLIAFTLGLLVIVAGMKLMAQTQKENLSNLYKYVSWFVVVMGFLCLMCVGMHCAMRCCHRGDRCKMENRCDMDGGYDDGCYMMRHHHGMMGGCIMGRSCYDEMMSNGCYNNMNGSCKEGENCNEKMGSNCTMGNGGSCPMMKNGMSCNEKDTVVVKKEIKK